MEIFARESGARNLRPQGFVVIDVVTIKKKSAMVVFPMVFFTNAFTFLYHLIFNKLLSRLNFVGIAHNSLIMVGQTLKISHTR